MANGFACRVQIDTVQALAALISNFASNEACALGRLNDGLPDRVRVVRRDKLNAATDVIARTHEHLIFKEGESGFVPFDADFTDMSDAAKQRMKATGTNYVD